MRETQSGGAQFMAETGMKRTVGVIGVAVTLIGFVIGASIFILPGALAATAGPGVVLSYCIAGVMALFSCVVAAQVGAVFPTSGGSFVALSRLLSPFWGFAGIWFIVGGVSGAVALVAYGFADYALLLLPWFNRVAMAVLIILALAGLNLLGIKETILGQGVMVAIFMAALGLFSVAGLVSLDRDLLVPFMPNGLGPVLAAAVPAAFSFSGFMVVIELGGEVKNPSRTVPLALAISFATVLVVYIAVSVSVVGVIPWQELEGIGAPVSEATARILPGWMTWGITLAMLAASASSINVLLLGFSRDVYALARVKTLPEIFARISEKHGEPVNGVLAIAALSLLVVAVGGSIAQLATLTVVALLALQAGLGVAALLIPRKLPDLYRDAGFRLGPVALPFVAWGLILISVAFLVRAVMDDPGVVLIAAAYLLVGMVYYAFRKSALSRRGVDVVQLVRDQVDTDSAQTEEP
jgi:APA family basic amino acid/polyamine antiporter